MNKQRFEEIRCRSYAETGWEGTWAAEMSFFCGPEGAKAQAEAYLASNPDCQVVRVRLPGVATLHPCMLACGGGLYGEAAKPGAEFFVER